MGEKLTDWRLLDEMRALLGVPHTARLLGWAMLFGLSGVETIDGIRHATWVSTGTRYKVASDFVSLHHALRAKGYDLASADELIPMALEIRAGGVYP
jgi:hypothetical protein